MLTSIQSVVTTVAGLVFFQVPPNRFSFGCGSSRLAFSRFKSLKIRRPAGFFVVEVIHISGSEVVKGSVGLDKAEVSHLCNAWETRSRGRELEQNADISNNQTNQLRQLSSFRKQAPVFTLFP